MSIISFTKSISVGTQVSAITGDIKEGMAAAGYSSWVQSITGEPAIVTNLGENRARLTLSDTQRQQMRVWLEGSLMSSLDPRAPKKPLEIDFAEVVKPSGVKFGLIAASALIGIGFLGKNFIDNI